MALLSEYGFHEGAGTVSRDSSGNGRNLAASNSSTSWDTTNPKERPAAAKLEHSAGAVGPNLSTSTWTVMAWIRRDGTWAAGLWAAAVANLTQNFFIDTSPDNSYAPAVAGSTPILGTTVLPIGVWMHVAAVCNATVTTLYVNGTAEGGSGVCPAKNFGSGGTWAIASSSATSGDGADWPGAVDDVRFFDTALSAAAITAWMNAPVRPPDGLVLSSETYLAGGTIFDSSTSSPLGSLYQLPDYELDLADVPPTPEPGFVPQPLNRRRTVWRFRPRSAQPTPAQLDAPQSTPRSARHVWHRGTARSASPVPDQTVAPSAPTFIPGVGSAHRSRWRPRRGGSAQPVPTQPQAPGNPDIVYLATAARRLFGRRRSEVAAPAPQQEQPPSVAKPARRTVRPRRSETSAPVADQQTLPPAAARSRLRRPMRRPFSQVAESPPAQQTVPPNPEIVSAMHALHRKVMRRGSGRTAAPTPSQAAAPINPEIISAVHVLRRKWARRGPGRTASPVPAQAAPVNPPFVPASLRRPRRALRRTGHASAAPPQQLGPVQTPTAPLRTLLRRARRRFAQVFVFVAPPLGRFITVDIVVGDDRYDIVVGDDRYEVELGNGDRYDDRYAPESDRYELAVGQDRFDVAAGDDRYEIEVE